MKYKDYYQIMGVARTATPEEIKKAWRKLAHQYHPDVSKDTQGEEKFKELAEAYEVLKDPEKRKAYDELGRRPTGESFTPPPDWQQNFKTGGTGFEDVDLADLFAAFGNMHHAGKKHRQDFSSRGQDFEVPVTVTLEQIFRGEEIGISLEIPEYDANGLAHRVPKTFKITLPKTASDGQRLRLTGKGGPGANGGAAGDLYIILKLKVHPHYRVDGRDLYLDLPLAPWEAVLGGEVHVPTLAGDIMLNIKPGTTSGQKYRLAKRGLPTTDGAHGTLYVVVRIEVPSQVTPTEKSLYEQLAKSSQFNPRQHFTRGAGK